MLQAMSSANKLQIHGLVPRRFYLGSNSSDVPLVFALALDKRGALGAVSVPGRTASEASEKDGPIGYTYRLYDLPEGEYVLRHSRSVRRTELWIYQKNILKESSLEKEEQSTLLRVQGPAQDRLLVFQQESTAHEQGWIIGPDKPWPFVAPAFWNCPLLLSIEGNLDQWDILWPAEAKLIVEDGAQESVFFGPTKPAPLHSQLLQILPKAQVIALARGKSPS